MSEETIKTDNTQVIVNLQNRIAELEAENARLKAGDWREIRSEDDLPSESGEYLITFGHIISGSPEVGIAEFVRSRRQWFDIDRDSVLRVEVRAWRPLPAPFVKEGE